MPPRVSVYTTLPTPFPGLRKLLRAALHFVLEREGVRQGTIRLILTDDATIQALNRQFLQHDYPTDVLTFVLEDQPLQVEIYIGSEQAYRQAAEYGVTVQEELVRLSIHGVLHALGYDDQTPEQRQRMEERQEYYLHHFLRSLQPSKPPSSSTPP
jgi:probable rRNA maturation factor